MRDTNPGPRFSLCNLHFPSPVFYLTTTRTKLQDALSAVSSNRTLQAKYPNLEKLKTTFWNTIEEVNNGNKHSKLAIRDARNLVGTVLANQLFWNLVTDVMKKQAKYTHDKRKADTKIRVCDMVTETLTSPGMADGFLRMADDVYETTVRLNTDAAEVALDVATDVINSGGVSKFLDRVSGVVDDITLDEELAHRLFDLSRKYIDVCGMMKLNGKNSEILKRVTTAISKQGTGNSGNNNNNGYAARQDVPRSTSNIQRSVSQKNRSK